MTLKKFALFKYPQSLNLGDEIQSIAAKQFLPKEDYLIDRDNYDGVRIDGEARLIANGWFTKSPEQWPPKNKRIKPLYISMHIDPECSTYFSTVRSDEYLRENGSIGCRDYATMKFLRARGVPAYFSGCLTLTLKKPDSGKKERILLVDPPAGILETLPPVVQRDVFVLSNMVKSPRLGTRWLKKLKKTGGIVSHKLFMKMAADRLKMYASARVVVTSRLHCALPCVAMGVPVYFIPRRIDDPRFGGLKTYTHCLTERDFAEKIDLIDWKHPTPNPGDPEPLKELLTNRCRQFLKNDNPAK